MNRSFLLQVIRETIRAVPEVRKHIDGKVMNMIWAEGERDPREPGLQRKTELERTLTALFIARLKKQLASIQTVVGKAAQIVPPKIPPLPVDEEDKFYLDLITELSNGAVNGIGLLRNKLPQAFDSRQPNMDAVSWAKEYAYDLVKGIDATSQQIVSDAIAAFTGEPGFTIGDVIENLGSQFGDNRARMIAVTETTRAFAQGQLIAAQQLQSEFPDVPMNKTWFTNNDDRVCDICGPMEGETVNADEPFSSGDDTPPAHVNCLPGNSLISPIGRIAATSKRQYDGDMIVINTASQYSLTCTPNHPVLTRLGWVGAGLLNVGDNVICHARKDGMPVGTTYNQNMPTSIENIFEAFGSSGKVFAAPVPISTEDFHGDGKDGDVAIIKSDSLLRDKFDTPVGQESNESLFLVGLMRNIMLNGKCSLDFFIDGHDPSSCSNMGAIELMKSFVSGHLAPFETLGFTLMSNGDIVLCKPSANSPTINTKLVREFILGLTTNIFSDQITSVNRYSYHGFVYNLQSESSIYFTNYIMVSNCRCWVDYNTNLGG